MSWIPSPLIEPEDDRVPVTVLLTPAQAARLEVLVASHRERDPAADDNTIVDAIFASGLEAAEAQKGRTMNYELKHGIALVLRGPQGCGKSRLAREIAAAYGTFVEVDAHVLSSGRALNDAIASEPNTLIVDGLPQGEEALKKLKAMISSETMRFDRKHGQSKQAKTPHFIFCTGSADPLPRLENGLRRFFVVNLPSGKNEDVQQELSS